MFGTSAISISCFKWAKKEQNSEIVLTFMRLPRFGEMGGDYVSIHFAGETVR